MDLKYCLIVLLIILRITPAFAADLTDDYLKSKPQGNSLDKTRWEKLKDNYKYKYPKTQKNQTIQKSVPVAADPGWSSFLAYGAIFILLAVVIWLLTRFGLFGNRSLAKKKIDFDINTEPEDINDLEIDPLLDQALKNRDYRLATRLKFLALLQLLNRHHLINWRRDKTNSHYINQLSGLKIQSPFMQLCLVYERVWYGDHFIDEHYYLAVNERFLHFHSTLKNVVYA